MHLEEGVIQATVNRRSAKAGFVVQNNRYPRGGSDRGRHNFGEQGQYIRGNHGQFRSRGIA